MRSGSVGGNAKTKNVLCQIRYMLTMNTSLSTDAPPDRAAISALIRQHVPDAVHLRSSGSELVCCPPSRESLAPHASVTRNFFRGCALRWASSG